MSAKVKRMHSSVKAGKARAQGQRGGGDKKVTLYLVSFLVGKWECYNRRRYLICGLIIGGCVHICPFMRYRKPHLVSLRL